MASGWNLWVWLQCIGVASRCCYKELPYSGLFSKNKFSAKSAIIGEKNFRMLLFSANQVLDQNIRVIITGMCTLFPDTSHSTHEATHGVVVVCY